MWLFKEIRWTLICYFLFWILSLNHELLLLSCANGLSFSVSKTIDSRGHFVHFVLYSVLSSNVRSDLNVSLCDQQDRKDLCLIQITNTHWWKVAGRGWWEWKRHTLIPSSMALLYRMMSGLIWISASSLSRRERPLLFPLNSLICLLHL